MLLIHLEIIQIPWQS